MLELKNIWKYYNLDKRRNVILNNVSLKFKSEELVFILGKSGSGKSTLLNIIGGILKSDSGQIYFNREDICKYNQKKLDNYRKNTVGFIFQDYNLIDYMNVIDNIKISGCDNKSKLDILLKQLDIYDKRYMKVSKLSGGEKQRVAIARAIINEPEILLCDEPTGALDSENGKKIMDILKKVSKNKLVIVVSHDNYLANKYADRIININDGKINCDEINLSNKDININKNRNKRKFLMFKLAFKNLMLKKGRTVLTSLAISLGIISMMLVLSLSNSFNKEIDKLSQDIVSVFPISISNLSYDMGYKTDSHKGNKIYIKKNSDYIHENVITKEYLDYVNDMDEIKYITYNYDISMPIISDRGNYLDNEYMKVIPGDKYINDNYDILYGRNIENINEILLKVDSNNSVSEELLNRFNIFEDINYEEILGRKIKILTNNDYYVKNGNYFYINNDIKDMYNKSEIELSIVGIIREKEEVENTSQIYYDGDIINIIIGKNKNSEIVNYQLVNEYNVLGIDVNKNDMLSYLGYNTLPNSIYIYIDNLLDKDIVIDKLDEYNNANKKLIYEDTMADAIGILRDFINIISVVLIIFSLVAILVSSLMITILTNTRVIERRKEIGILRSLGASKRKIINLFCIENMIIGMIAFFISFGILSLLVEPINMLLNNTIGFYDVFSISTNSLIITFIINLLLIILSGYIPSRKASKMEIVNCIYNR